MGFLVLILLFFHQLGFLKVFSIVLNLEIIEFSSCRTSCKLRAHRVFSIGTSHLPCTNITRRRLDPIRGVRLQHITCFLCIQRTVVGALENTRCIPALSNQPCQSEKKQVKSYKCRLPIIFSTH